MIHRRDAEHAEKTMRIWFCNLRNLRVLHSSGFVCKYGSVILLRVLRVSAVNNPG